MAEGVNNSQPFELLLGQKISVIRSIHRGSSKTIEALEIETKQGRVVHFIGPEATMSAGPVTSDMLGEKSGLVRIDRTECLSFAFRSDQLVDRVERLQKTTGKQSNTLGWQVYFSSNDYFVIFPRDGAINVICNELPGN